ncbi:DUF2851 family protein [Pseudotenacibaculum haliotis]|uniref:DUF2851 family protein n=1 Tax=Pseudotenacibaculum haliotis TaxID=1862138 RepID=A0ABW5LVW4_9FLAO
MKEDFLHYLWRYQLFDVSSLKTTNNQPLSIIRSGLHNEDSGPDFLNARIYLEGQMWVGNVEIHIRSSDWYYHQHENDENYDAVLLHVVWQHDVEVFMKNNKPIPTLELRHFVNDSIVKNYQRLQGRSPQWIPCDTQIDKIDSFVMNNWLERLYIERLERKSIDVKEQLKKTDNDWEAVLFLLLSKNFGLNKNGEAFLDMASSIPFSVVRKESCHEERLYALFFGQAGFLEEEIEVSYHQKLKEEYKYLKHKHQLKPIPKKLFQFFRMRPSNFPTIRLAQLSALYTKNRSLFADLMACKQVEDFYKLFAIELADFWKTHYTFTKESKTSHKKLTTSFVDLLIINTIIPLKFSYQKSLGKLNEEELIELLKKVRPEKNSIVEKFKSLKLEVEDAFTTQALLELKNNYCAKKRCLQCAIGNQLIRN